MIHKIKGLGLAFVAVAAMSMVAASAVQASELHVAGVSGANAAIFGQQTEQHTFITDSGHVKCNQALFEAKAVDQGAHGTQLTSQELTTTATYTGCTAFGLAATIDMNGCKYTITNKSGAGVTTAETAYVDITGCTSGKSIEVKAAAGCVVTVPEQHNLGTLTFTDKAGSPNDVDVTVNVSGIKYEGHGLCPSLPATTSTSNGTYTGKATFQARDFVSEVQATHNGHQYQKLTATGTLRGLEAT